MAEPEAVASNEDGWRFCSVCKRNHEEGRKHIFTRKHVNKLKILMGKFLKKVFSSSHTQLISNNAYEWCTILRLAVLGGACLTPRFTQESWSLEQGSGVIAVRKRWTSTSLMGGYPLSGQVLLNT